MFVFLILTSPRACSLTSVFERVVGRHRDKEAAHDRATCVRTEMPRRTSHQQRPLQPRNPTLVCQRLRYALAIDTEPAQLEERLPHRRAHLKRRHICSAYRSSYSVSDAQRPSSAAGQYGDCSGTALMARPLWSDKLGCFLTAGRLKNALSRSGILRKFVRWATRPQHQFATTVGTLSTEDLTRAGPAECAFERTDECVNSVGWQITIATFAVRTELQHFALLRYLATQAA